MENKKVEIEWNGKKAIVEVRPLKFGEMFEINKAAVKKRIQNGITIEDVDDEKMAVLTMLKCIVKAPFEVNEENILNLDVGTATRIMEAINELSSFQTVKK